VALATLGLLSAIALPRLVQGAEPSRSLSISAADPREAEAALVRTTAAEPPLRHALAFVDDGGKRSELIWYHPIAGQRELPGRASRRFGAAREHSRPECGEGHCGVDLGGEIGTVIHAALPGRVAKIVRGESGRGGRYVKLEHEGGIVSYYMHLDEIQPDLVVGVELAAGEPLGTLGASGIQRSEAHLHFQVAIPEGGRPEFFVDPEPMLEQAILLEEAAAIR
jgi:murein DD-endopeptidase MepM/ murein hydrolase activator NlpD